MNINELAVLEELIPVEVYQHIRAECGMSMKTQTAAEIGLKHSLYSVIIRHKESIIGMGRVIGDGGIACQVVDICVVPDYQGFGVGKMIMNCIMGFIEKNLPSSCYISLIADGDASFLYEKYGFKDTLPKSRGMYYRK